MMGVGVGVAARGLAVSVELYSWQDLPLHCHLTFPPSFPPSLPRSRKGE